MMICFSINMIKNYGSTCGFVPLKVSCLAQARRRNQYSSLIFIIRYFRYGQFSVFNPLISNRTKIIEYSPPDFTSGGIVEKPGKKKKKKKWMGKADQLASSVLQRVSTLQLHYITLQQYLNQVEESLITISSYTIYYGLHQSSIVFFPSFFSDFLFFLFYSFFFFFSKLLFFNFPIFAFFSFIFLNYFC